MTLKQWWEHVCSWWYSARNFPLPRDATHMWVGVVGEREQDCMICGAHGVDREISDEELARDRAMSAAYDELHKKYFREDEEE